MTYTVIIFYPAMFRCVRIFYQEGKVRVILRRGSQQASQPASQQASQPDDVGRSHDACMKALPLFSEFVAPLFPLLFATQQSTRTEEYRVRPHSIRARAYVALQSFEEWFRHHLAERNFSSKKGSNFDHTRLGAPVACQPEA